MTKPKKSVFVELEELIKNKPRPLGMSWEELANFYAEHSKWHGKLVGKVQQLRKTMMPICPCEDCINWEDEDCDQGLSYRKKECDAYRKLLGVDETE